MGYSFDFLWRALLTIGCLAIGYCLGGFEERLFTKSMTTKQKIDRLQAELNEMHRELSEKLRQLEALKNQQAAEAHAEAGRSGELH